MKKVWCNSARICGLTRYYFWQDLQRIEWKPIRLGLAINYKSTTKRGQVGVYKSKALWLRLARQPTSITRLLHQPSGPFSVSNNFGLNTSVSLSLYISPRFEFKH